MFFSHKILNKTVCYLYRVLIRLNENNLSFAQLEPVIRCLKDGGIIIYPTDTIYALGCDITKTRAIERICRLKDIKPEKANFSFVCSDLSHLSEFTAPIPNHIFRGMKKALPGPYTFILDANNNVPKLLKHSKKTVGIRVPDNRICREIVQALGNPLISTSVHNEKDEIVEYYSDPAQIFQEFGDKVDMVIDGGFGNIYPSSVIDCSDGTFSIVREGLGDISIFQ